MRSMATFNEQMVTKIQNALLSNVDVAEVTVDGVTTKFTSRRHLTEALEHYKSLVAKDGNSRPIATRIRTGNWL